MTNTLTDPRRQLITLVADMCCLPHLHGITIIANLAVISRGRMASVEGAVKSHTTDSLLRAAMPFTMVANLLLVCSSMLALSSLMASDCHRTISCAVMMHRYWLPMILGDCGVKNHQAHGRFIRLVD